MYGGRLQTDVRARRTGATRYHERLSTCKQGHRQGCTNGPSTPRRLLRGLSRTLPDSADELLRHHTSEASPHTVETRTATRSPGPPYGRSMSRSIDRRRSSSSRRRPKKWAIALSLRIHRRRPRRISNQLSSKLRRHSNRSELQMFQLPTTHALSEFVS